MLFPDNVVKQQDMRQTLSALSYSETVRQLLTWENKAMKKRATVKKDSNVIKPLVVGGNDGDNIDVSQPSVSKSTNSEAAVHLASPDSSLDHNLPRPIRSAHDPSARHVTEPEPVAHLPSRRPLKNISAIVDTNAVPEILVRRVLDTYTTASARLTFSYMCMNRYIPYDGIMRKKARNNLMAHLALVRSQPAYIRNVLAAVLRSSLSTVSSQERRMLVIGTLPQALTSQLIATGEERREFMEFVLLARFKDKSVRARERHDIHGLSDEEAGQKLQALLTEVPLSRDDDEGTPSRSMTGGTESAPYEAMDVDHSTVEFLESVLARRFPGAEGEEEREVAKKYIETLPPAEMMEELQLLLAEVPQPPDAEEAGSPARSAVEQEMEDMSTWFEGGKPDDDGETSAFHGDGSFKDFFSDKAVTQGKEKRVANEAGSREDERLAAESERVRGRSVIQGS